MTHRHIDTTDIRTYIKIFLSMCDIFDTHTYEREISSLIWYAKPNFLSLMNIPDQIDQFGPVYLHWDGVRKHFLLLTLEKTIDCIYENLNYRQIPVYKSYSLLLP